MRGPSWLLAAGLLASGLLAFPALAGSSPDSPLDVERPAADGVALDEQQTLFAEIPSVSSASKYDQKITEAPAAVSIVTADEIGRYGYQTLAEILDSLPGLFTTYDRTFHYVAMRGFGVAGDVNNRVLLLVDGHRMNDSLYGQAPIGLDFPLDVDLIERVEVVRGPASVLYGASAFLGVINVVTKRGRDLQRAEVAALGGSHSTYGGRLSWGDRYAGGAEVLLSTSYDGSDGMRRLYFREFDDGVTSQGVAHDADRERAPSFYGAASYRDFTIQTGHVDREKGIPTATYETLFDTSRTLVRDARTFVNTSWAHELRNGWHLDLRAQYNRLEERGNYLYEEIPRPVMNVDAFRAERLGAGFDVRGRVDRHQLTWGMEVAEHFRLDQRNFDEAPAFEYIDSRERATDWGVFLQDELRLRSDLVLVAGIRHDENTFFGGSTNPRLALVWSPSEATTWKLLYGRAFRAPSAFELFYHDGNFSQKPAENLDTETIEAFELVMERVLVDRLRLVGAVYYSEIEDLISLELDPADDLLVYRNGSGVKSVGFEARLEGRVFGAVESRASYAIQRTEDARTGDRVPNSPRHLAKLNLSVPLWQEALFGSIELRYVDERRTLSGDNAGSFLVADLTLLAREWLPRLEASAGVRNLFDARYTHPVSSEHTQDEIEQDGRTFFVRLERQF